MRSPISSVSTETTTGYQAPTQSSKVSAGAVATVDEARAVISDNYNRLKKAIKIGTDELEELKGLDMWSFGNDGLFKKQDYTWLPCMIKATRKHFADNSQSTYMIEDKTTMEINQDELEADKPMDVFYAFKLEQYFATIDDADDFKVTFKTTIDHYNFSSKNGDIIKFFPRNEFNNTRSYDGFNEPGLFRIEWDLENYRSAYDINNNIFYLEVVDIDIIASLYDDFLVGEIDIDGIKSIKEYKEKYTEDERNDHYEYLERTGLADTEEDAKEKIKMTIVDQVPLARACASNWKLIDPVSRGGILNIWAYLYSKMVDLDNKTEFKIILGDVRVFSPFEDYADEEEAGFVAFELFVNNDVKGEVYVDDYEEYEFSKQADFQRGGNFIENFYGTFNYVSGIQRLNKSMGEYNDSKKDKSILFNNFNDMKRGTYIITPYYILSNNKEGWAYNRMEDEGAEDVYGINPLIEP